MTRFECAARECCWDPSHRTPWCFKPIQRCPYIVINSTLDSEYTLENKCYGRQHRDFNAIPYLKMSMHHLRYGVVNIKIKPVDYYDVSSIVHEYFPKPEKRSNKKEPKVNLVVDQNPFGLQVWRRSDGMLLFDSQDLVFQEYFVSIQTRLSPNSTLHGLGYRAGPLKLSPGKYAIWARDASTLPTNGNLYSAQPMYINVENERAYGVFFMNTHAMEADLSGESLKMKMLGGDLNIFIFPGPTIEKIHKQYLSIIGVPPAIDPRFFGLQQSRYGYKTLSNVKNMVKKYKNNRLPLDVVWLDIEY